MKTIIPAICLIILISCKKDNPSLGNDIDVNNLKFSTEKIIIEEIPELSGKLNFHILIKLENIKNKTSKLPVNGLLWENEKKQNRKTFFTLKTKDKSYPIICYLFKSTTDTLYINTEKPTYILLSSVENINRENLYSASLQYRYEYNKKIFYKSFLLNTEKTERIITDHRINTEEAIKLSHGKINNIQY